MKISILFVLILLSLTSWSQNDFPNSGDAKIQDAKMVFQTTYWLPSLITMQDTHYNPYQTYHFQIESDGLKIKQDDTVNYQFKSGGDFVVRNGNILLGQGTPLFKLHIKDPIGGAALGLERGGKFWRFDLQNNSDRLYIGHSDNSSMFTFHKNGNFGIGTTAPDAKLAVKGDIHAEEVKVDLAVPGPDYVFKEDYDLKPLEEVQNYIKEHGHLPNIPSAKEMGTNGIQLGEMNMKLLEKIEELTLYIIEQNRKIDELEKDNDKLQKLEQRIIYLEKK
ncbi:hypothetical protein SAMN04487891_1205 [Flagellimonas taeanensis]|uniref:Uncharacterized protein n=1 Tax=Flagellimonas taeanensis TaxID=1005926 RepID=A0A1M7CY70_9FLAO|nr:hypothetical protein [Allomuricauda taeanensis]SFC66676.1 hypothetical protein SAMN04487891_1205 [Allomuricauda taeanensis]SHL72204.1 hypothetical protein SAMN05216293_4143 [Allomuricauda taeanensis]